MDGFDDNPGIFLINVKSYFLAFIHLWIAILTEVVKTIFANNNFVFSKKGNETQPGLTRSAIFLIFFVVIHAVGNLHVFMGPDDFNGYGYFYVRLYWTGFGLPANIVEEYILLSALLHVFAGLKRTWDLKLNQLPESKPGAINLIKNICDSCKKLSLFLTGFLLLLFMTIHLLQFRFGATQTYFIRPPPYLINFAGIPSLNLFWTDNTDVPATPVRDIYKMEFDRFTNEEQHGFFWSCFYIFSVLVFFTHACLGWWNVVNTDRLGIPKGHRHRVKIMGFFIFLVLGLLYGSFPLFCMLTDKKFGEEKGINPHIESSYLSNALPEI